MGRPVDGHVPHDQCRTWRAVRLELDHCGRVKSRLKVGRLRGVADNGSAEIGLNVESLDQELVSETLDTIVKYEGDVRKAQEELKDYVRRVRARRGTETGSDKDLLN